MVLVLKTLDGWCKMKLTVYIFRRPNMFLVQQNLYNLVGLSELERLFTVEGYKTQHKSVTWYYPERFLNIIEQRVLIQRAESAGYEEVMIVTNSVYIVQCCVKENIRIVQDELIPEDGRFKLSNDYSGLPNDSGLNVIHWR